MNFELTYIEKNLKQIMALYPQAYGRILSGEELSDFIFLLMEKHSSSISRNSVLQESEELIAGDFFIENIEDIVSNRMNDQQKEAYRLSFSRQNESSFLKTGYDIAYSRMIRYMPAQWHQDSFFFVYFAKYGTCRIHFRDSETITLNKGNLLIVAPFVEHATPCYHDDSFLEYFMIRSSSFEKTFYDQLNRDSIMAHFFRNALNRNEKSPTAYLLFDTGCDSDILHVIDTIKEEIAAKLPYSSSLINALTSVLFSLTLRRYEDTVLLPNDQYGKWKKEYSRIFSYIQNHFIDSNLQEISKACGYSSKQISRIVSSCFNMTYNQLATFLKMDKAVSLLKENTLSIQEISSCLGYSDLPSFYRAFKKYYRMTPAEYLKQE